MSFQQGLSGLASSSKSLDVTSNNIANASTVGFKSASAQFADVFASALSGASTGLQIGIGSTINGVRQAFTQGNLATSNNPLDLAINGNGFFRLERTDGSIAYTRNGQFDIDRDGFIVSASGDRLTGFPVSSIVNGVSVFEGTPNTLQIDTSNIAPRATQAGVSITANLDSRDRLPTTLTPPGPAFDPTLAPAIPVESYNATTSLNVFDSLGNPHSLTLYFIRSDPPDSLEWTVWAGLDAEEPVEVTAGAPLTFNSQGVIAPGQPTSFDFAWALDNGAENLQFPIDLQKVTQFGSPFSVTALTQDGFTTGQLTGIVTNSDGIVQGRFSNGQTRDIGRIVLANFQSPNGLISLGNNLWGESPNSGQPTIGSPGTGVLGVLSAGTVEESNVDLTQELVNLIVQQRNYQANAQSIRAQDQILQTLVNLR
ncbi:flagellar hook protein FlgE [Rhodocyclaceae bacterium SMB388]